ncbi:MAG: ankyrin repeat domain-containing protein [Paludibacteraceae bacterium]|nr:ankyrin repeat domain-containing protein [Paludibacteraceae bacterium]
MKKLLFISILTLFVTAGNIRIFAQNIETASRKGNIEDMKICLSKGANPNYKWDKETILSHAFNDKTLEMPKLLINTKGIRINEWNLRPAPEVIWKFTALMRAVEYPDMVKLLLDKGALIDLQDEWLQWDGKPSEHGGNTALMLSVKDYTGSTKILLDRGAKINVQNRRGETALMLSVSNTETAKLLIDKGASLDIQTLGGETALMYAAGKYTDVVKLLLDKGADILIRQSTYKVSPNAMDYAARHGNIEAAKLILAKAISLGVKDEILYSAVHWAVIADQVEMVKYLLDQGANIEGNDDLGGYTPLMNSSLFEMVDLLVKRGANVNAKNKFNYTPLHKAVFNFVEGKRKEKDCKKILNLLISNGANLNAQDNNGNTPLMTAIQKTAPAKILIAKGADVNLANKNKETPLMLAAKGGLLKVVLVVPVIGPFAEACKLLIAKGADVNAQDVFGKTALMHAASAAHAQGDSYSSYTGLLSLLIEKGAKLEIEDKEGHTALYWAQRFNRAKSADLLIAKGANAAKKYDRAADKSNVKAGIVGTWENKTIAGKVSIITRVVFNANWTYSKVMISGGQTVPDGGGYVTYDLIDGRIWVYNKIPTSAVFEYRFEGNALILNGVKFTKVKK